jgi:hypothetical protein
MPGTMDKRIATKAFISEWMLEFSVLWAVFPLLDQLLSGHINGGLSIMTFVFVVVSSGIGILLKRSVS